MELNDLGHPPQRRKTAPWVMVTGVLFLLFAFWVMWSTLSYTNLEKPVRGQLSAIRQGRIPEAYYEYTSKSFQVATSLDQFKDFVEANAVLANNKSATFENPVFDDSIGILNGILFSWGGEKAPVLYRLERQNNEWKILNVQLSNPSPAELSAVSKNVTASSQESSELQAPIVKQLDQLKQGDEMSAYEGVSEGFKKATPFDAFQAFLKRFPIFKNHIVYAFEGQVVKDDRAAVRVQFRSESETVSVEYHLAKENGQWKIWSMQVLKPPVDAPDLKTITDPIKQQLQALRNSDYEKAYSDYVSSEFKKVTSFEAFTKFVNRFGIFTSYTSVDFEEPRIEKTGAKVIANFHDADGGIFKVEYTMGIEEGQWKIWGFRLIETQKKNRKQNLSQVSDDVFSVKTLAKLVNGQLDAIKQGNVEKAYQDYTAAEFKKATSLEAFSLFVESYPVLSNFSEVKFSDLSVDNNSATINAGFTDSKGKEVAVEYEFALNDKDQWKIMYIQILNPKDASIAAQEVHGKLSYFPKILIGTKIDANGEVVDEKSLIADRKKAIHSNIFVNGKKGDTISVVFKHLETNSSIPPVTSSPLPEDGVFRTSFSFNPPPTGWPEGNYALEITSSSGEEESYSFQIKS